MTGPAPCEGSVRHQPQDGGQLPRSPARSGEGLEWGAPPPVLQVYPEAWPLLNLYVGMEKDAQLP